MKKVDMNDLNVQPGAGKYFTGYNSLLFAIVALMVGIAIIYSVAQSQGYYTPGECHTTSKIIQSVKSCTGTGGIFGGSTCIYVTDKGEVTYPGGYGAGETIDRQTTCDPGKWGKQ